MGTDSYIINGRGGETLQNSHVALLHWPLLILKIIEKAETRFKRFIDEYLTDNTRNGLTGKFVKESVVKLELAGKALITVI